MELAFLFHKLGFSLEACTGDNITYRDLAFWLRRMFVYIGKLESQIVFPGRTCLQTRKSEGRAFPQGALLGAVPFFRVRSSLVWPALWTVDVRKLIFHRGRSPCTLPLETVVVRVLVVSFVLSHIVHHALSDHACQQCRGPPS